MDIFKSQPIQTLRSRLRHIEKADTRRSFFTQVALTIIDIAILLFFVLGPYLRSGPSYLVIDYAIAAWIGLEMVGRAIAAPSLRHWILKPLTWIDIVVLATLLFPDVLFNFAFLRVMRVWAIGGSPLLRAVLRKLACIQYLDVVRAVINFFVFLFLVTGFVYTTSFYNRDGGEGFVDALYFTVATVTTTGFGDIVLPGTLGKLTAVVTMIVGISLFVRLAQAVVRPNKVTRAAACGGMMPTLSTVKLVAIS